MKIYQKPENVRTLIFDIDSTLYTNPAYAFEQVDVQIRHFASLQGLSPDTARAEINAYRKSWSLEHAGRKISLGNTMKAFGIPIEESIRWRETLLDPDKYLKKDTKLAETLSVLEKRYALICVTNNPVLPARKTLEALGVEHLIPRIIGLDTCNVSKPAREPFLLAAASTDCRPQQCISIGDRYDIDIALPLELGMGGILVTGVTEVYMLPGLL